MIRTSDSALNIDPAGHNAGLACLFYFLHNHLQRSVQYQDMKRVFPATSVGYPLVSLRDICQAHHLQIEVLQAEGDLSGTISLLPLILLVERISGSTYFDYILLLEVEPGRCKVYFPDWGIVQITEGELYSIWPSGVALQIT